MLLVLHIGTHKTGATPVQIALARMDEMHALGVHFIETGREGRMAHHPLAWAIRNRNKTPISIWDGVRKELKTEKSPIKVISSEAFWYEDPLEVKRQLAWPGAVKIVVYVQRQDRHLAGLHKQAVAQGREISFADWMGEMAHRGEYLGVVEEWAEHFGRAAIAVRPFEQGDEPVDTLADFFGLIGIDIREAGIAGAGRARHPPPPAVQHFLSAAQKLGLDPEKLHAALVKRNKAYAQSADQMGHDEARALMARYGEANRALAQGYWRDEDGPLFPELVPAPLPGGLGIGDPAFAALTVDVLNAVMELGGAPAADGEAGQKQLFPKPA